MISFIIPMYNAIDTIVRCLDSIKKNLIDDNYEIIIVNDGSSDGCDGVVSNYIQEHKNLKIKLFNKENGGVSSARNYGLSRAVGNYVWFVDSDDEIAKNSLKKIYDEKFYEYDIYKFNYFIEKISNMFLVKGTSNCKNLSDNFLYKYTFNSPCTQIYKTDFLKNNNLLFNENLSYGEDFLFNLKAYSLTKKYKITNNYLYVYKKSANSITRSYSIDKINKKFNDVLNSYGKMSDFINYYGFNYKKIISRIYKELVNVLLDVNDIDLYNVFETNKENIKLYSIDVNKILRYYNKKKIIYRIKKSIKKVLK